MKYFLIFSLSLLSVIAHAQTKVVWKCEDSNVQSSFVATYDFATKKGQVKLKVVNETATLKMSSYQQYGRPVTIWIKTTQTFMDENVLMGFRLSAVQGAPRSKRGKLFYFDRTSGDILGFDEEANFKCTQKI